MSKVNKLGQYKGIEVNVEKHIATKEEVEQQVQALVAQNPTLVEKDEKLHMVISQQLILKDSKNGVAFDGGKA